MHCKETCVPSGFKKKKTTDIRVTFMVQSKWVLAQVYSYTNVVYVLAVHNICRFLQRWLIWSKAQMTRATKAQKRLGKDTSHKFLRLAKSTGYSAHCEYHSH